MESSVDTRQPGVKKARYLWQILIKIVLDLVVPTAGYYALRGAGLQPVIALCLVAVPALVYFAYRLTRGQRVDSFEMFVLAIIALSDLASFINDNPRLALSTDGIVSFLITVACLISLKTRRPLVYLLIRSILDNTWLRVKHHTDDWDAMWRNDPAFRKPWVVSTIVWAGFDIVAGIVRLGIAFYAPVDAAPMWLGLVTLTVVVATQIWQSQYLKFYFRKTGAFVSSAKQRFTDDVFALADSVGLTKPLVLPSDQAA